MPAVLSSKVLGFPLWGVLLAAAAIWFCFMR
jgi:hypothetical protein